MGTEDINNDSTCDVDDCAGPAGPTGAQGATGATGAQGPAGIDAEDGIYEFAQADGESSTTSKSYQTKLTFTTTNLDSGDYVLRWYYEVRGGGDSHGRVVSIVNKVTTEYGFSSIDSSTNDYNAAGGFYPFTGISGVHTFYIQYKSNRGTAYIRNARLSIETPAAPGPAGGGGGDFSDGGEAGGAARTLGNTDAHALGFETNNIERVRIQSDGRVGIATTAPTSNFATTIYADSGANGLHLKAGEVSGDLALRVSDQDETFTIMEVEADSGHVVLGKTYAQTLTDNAIVYGVDNQNSGDASDFNTQEGVYRIGGSQMVYMTEFQYASSDAESSTTSTTLQTKVTLTTPSIPAGDYRLGWTWEGSHSNSGIIAEFEVAFDGVVVALPTFEYDDDYLAYGGFVVQTLASGARTATIKYRTQTATGTALIRRARLEFWRIT